MAVTLLKVTNIGVRCGDTGIPLIKAVISMDSNSESIGVDMLEEIYSRAAGMVAAAAPRVNAVMDPDLIPDAIQVYTPGSHTYGGDTGFKFTFNVERWGGGNNKNNGVGNLNLYYNNNLVAYTTYNTGYATFECSYIVVFVDESNNIFRSNGGNSGLYMLYDKNPGVAVSGGVTVAPVLSGYSMYGRLGTTLTKSTDNISNDIINEIDPDITDPFNPGGDSGTGGGTGTFDGTGDDIDIPGLPTLSAVDTGFITLFNPSQAELQNLANYMWGDLFDIKTWKKIFADPMDAILGLSIVPVAVPNGGSREVTVGNISTGISMNKAAAQYVAVDCGTLDVKEYWGAYLDYDPFTKAEIYLPYIGTHPLAVDDIMGKSIHVVYHVDILSGACCAYVKCGGSILYSFVGQCSCSIPITGNDWTNVVNGALSIAASIGTMVATGGATAPMAATTIASTAVNSMKPNVEKSGSMGGMGGMLAVQTPYLILTRPRQALPKSQNKFTGYPSFITEKLDSISGYTEIESIHLENIPATESELTEIENLLKSGVVF